MRGPQDPGLPVSQHLSRSLPQLSNQPPCHCPSCCTCTQGSKRRSWTGTCPLVSFPIAEHRLRPMSMVAGPVTELDELTRNVPSRVALIETAPNPSPSTDVFEERIPDGPPCTAAPEYGIQGNGQAGDCMLKPAGVDIGVQVKSGEERIEPGSSKRASAHEQSPIITLGRRKRFRRPKGVPTVQFHTHLKTMLAWYEDFDDSQKNDFLKQLLEVSHSPQMHLLSTLMGPILHANCPHNCRDILYWLPPSISLQILSYLDVTSLVECQGVNTYWYSLSGDTGLWKDLCHRPFYRLATKVSTQQLEIFRQKHGYIPWKQVFVERYRLQQNWLNGNCSVRTFEGHTQGITCVQFDDNRIVSGSSDKTIKVWSTQSNSPWAGLTLRGHSGTVRCLHLNNNQLVSGSSDCTIKVWDLAEGVGWSRSRCTVTMVGHSHTVRCLQVGHGYVLSGSYDHTLKKWRLDTGECVGTLRGHAAAVLAVQFDTERVVSGSCDNTIKVWCFKRGDCVSTLSGHRNAVTCIHFDQSRIVSGSLDTQIRLWDIKSERCIQTLDWANSEGHTGVVRCLQADTWRIVSAADDKTIKVWSLESGKRLVTLREHKDGVTCLQFNDLKIVSGSYDKTVKLWDFTKSR